MNSYIENSSTHFPYTPFPQSDSVGDVAKKLVLLLSMELFTLSESDSNSDVTITKFGMGSVPFLRQHQPIDIAQWKQS